MHIFFKLQEESVCSFVCFVFFMRGEDVVEIKGDPVTTADQNICCFPNWEIKS